MKRQASRSDGEQIFQNMQQNKIQIPRIKIDRQGKDMVMINNNNNINNFFIGSNNLINQNNAGKVELQEPIQPKYMKHKRTNSHKVEKKKENLTNS